MPSPRPPQPTGLPADTATTTSNAFHPSLARRSSFEPMRLGALPPPVFTRGAPGQRSVPAVEYLKQEAAANASASAAPGSGLVGAAVGSDGTVTPSAGLGNGLMSKEPWNLWNDATAPAVSIAPADVPETGITVNKEDAELASALAASGLIDNADKVSKRSSLTVWHEESDKSKVGEAQALEASATPDALKPSNSASELGAPNTSSLLPRNVSFSSLLDLPQPNGPAGLTGGSPLKRATSLKYSSSDNVGASTATASSPLGPATKSLYSSPVAPSTIGQRQARTASNSPTNSRDLSLPFGQNSRSVGGAGPANVPAIGAGAFGTPGGVSAFDGIDAGLGMRSRQPSTFSDVSVASMPFGAFFASGPGSNAQQDPFGAGGVYGGRRDSGYGMSSLNSSSLYGNSGRQDRRGNSSYGYNSGGNRSFASFESIYSPSLGPSPYPFSVSGSPENSYANNSGLGMGASSAIGSQGMIRYPTNGSSNDGMMPSYGFNASIPGPANYGLGVGLVGPASPFMGYGTPIPLMPAGYPFAGLAMSAMPGSELYGYDKPRRFHDKGMPIRSPLLEEFRADKTRQWGVADMQGHIAEFTTDQLGSRYIQQHILEAPSAEDVDRIFEEVCPVVLQLSTDVFANFCIQRLMEKATVQQVDALVQGLQGSILRLSLQTYGCRVIQKALEVVSEDTQLMMIRELEHSVTKCVRDQNANHVVQKLVQSCAPESLQGMVNAFIGHVYSFATHPYSCRVLQRILENCPERMTRPLLDELKSYAQNLMQDQYGNYVVQYVLEKGAPQDRSDIISVIYGQVLHLSKHKFASNVVEKCIMNANDMEIQAIAAEVLTPRLDGSTGIQVMLRHEFANYPLQRLIKHSTGQLHLAIVDQVCQQLTFFKMTTPPFTAKHLVAVEKLLIDLTPADFPSLAPHRRYEDHYVSRR